MIDGSLFKHCQVAEKSLSSCGTAGGFSPGVNERKKLFLVLRGDNACPSTRTFAGNSPVVD